MPVRVELDEGKHASDVSLAKRGTKEGAKNEVLWACRNKVPLKHMSERRKTVSLLAWSDGEIIGVFHGNTIPMHLVTREGEKLGVVKPIKDKSANRLEGEIFDRSKRGQMVFLCLDCFDTIQVQAWKNGYLKSILVIYSDYQNMCSDQPIDDNMTVRQRVLALSIGRGMR